MQNFKKKKRRKQYITRDFELMVISDAFFANTFIRVERRLQ